MGIFKYLLLWLVGPAHWSFQGTALPLARHNQVLSAGNTLIDFSTLTNLDSESSDLTCLVF